MKYTSFVVFLSGCIWADLIELDPLQIADITKVLNGKITSYDRNRRRNDDDVILYLYTNSVDGIVLTDNNLAEVDVNSNVVFVVHGWSAGINATWVKEITKGYLNKGNYNVVVVDWSKIANKPYSTAAGYVDDIGSYIGKLIVKLHRDHKADLRKIQVTAHSLGAQVAGGIGKTVYNITKSKIGKISGLDPARPLFEILDLSDAGKLTKEDAELVVIVHSDGGAFGYLHSAGHIDFFPNGGTPPQPGCLAADIVKRTTCSHGRGEEYFVEAVKNSKGFISTKCDSYLLYKLNIFCKHNKKITMGADLTLEDEGNYYLETNSEPPYSKD